MTFKFVGFEDSGLVVRDRAGEKRIFFEEILTAERLTSRRGFDLHTRLSPKAVRVRSRRTDHDTIESGLRFVGVRVVDRWGAIIAPTLLDFEEELAREPVGMRQSSDNA